MPIAALRPCISPRCAGFGVTNGRCRPCANQSEQARPNHEVRKWYRTARWRELRAWVLGEEPLCRTCKAANTLTPTTDVDHVTPHRGDPALFWDRRNLQGLCHPCHSRKTGQGQ